VRDAIYETLPAERRIGLHASAARYYAGRDLSLHAQHLERAEDPQASGAFVRAAGQERRAGNLEQALQLCARAASLSGSARERRGVALVTGTILLELGRAAEALDCFVEAEDAEAPAEAQAQAALGQADALRRLDRRREALAALVRAERLIDPLRSSALLSRVHYLRGSVLFPLGDAVACLQAQTLALEAARCAGSALGEAQALSGIADAHFAAGRCRTARTYFVWAEQAARQVGEIEIELTSLAMGALVDAYDLRFEAALATLRDVSERAASGARPRVEMLANTSSAWVCLLLGRWERAKGHAERALQLSEEIGSLRFGALARAYTTLAQSSLGGSASSFGDLDQALRLARASSVGFADGAVYAALLQVAAPEQVPPLLQEAEALAHELPMSFALLILVHEVLRVAHAHGACDGVPALVQSLEGSMAEEPHKLGELLAALGRTVARRDATDAAGDVASLRDGLSRAGLKPSLALLEQHLAHATRGGMRRTRGRRAPS